MSSEFDKESRINVKNDWRRSWKTITPAFYFHRICMSSLQRHQRRELFTQFWRRWKNLTHHVSSSAWSPSIELTRRFCFEWVCTRPWTDNSLCGWKYGPQETRFKEINKKFRELFQKWQRILPWQKCQMEYVSMFDFYCMITLLHVINAEYDWMFNLFMIILSIFNLEMQRGQFYLCL